MRQNLANYKPVRVGSPGDIYAFMSDLKHSDRERFYSLLLDARNAIVNCEYKNCGVRFAILQFWKL